MHHAFELTAEDLTRLRFFANESPDALEWLLDEAGQTRLHAGEVLLRPGQVNDTLYVLLSGEMHVHLEPDDDPVNLINPGDSAGEMSVLDGSPVSAWVIAAQPCQLLTIPASCMWRLISGSHVIAVNILGILSRWLRNNNAVVQQTRQLKSFFEYHARIDALTGLYNRRWLEESLQRFSARSDAAGQVFALLMLDADNFKGYNDAHGHLAGDSALRAIAEAINHQVRPTDVAARYGGEEFVVLLSDTDLHAAGDVAERVRNRVLGMPVQDDAGRPLPSVSVSIGVAAWRRGVQPGELLAAADTALYRAKHSGRNKVCRQAG